MSSKETVIKKKRKMAPWLKAMLIKFWFAGAVYFFIGYGLFLNTRDQLDLTFVLGLVLGVLTDLMVNKIFINQEYSKEKYYQFMMFPQQKYWGFLLNVGYGIVLSFFVAYTYHFINVIAISLNNLPETAVVLGAEPILFGVFCMAYDMLFLQIKKLFVKRKGMIENENK